MLTLEGGPFETARDSLAQIVMQCPELADLGLPEGNVFQADTANSPDTKPLVVIRWGDRETAVGGSWVDPVDVWFYDEFGDYNRATKMAKALAAYLVENAIHVVTQTGRISQILDRGIGGDLADDGFDALVKPYHLAVVGNGD